MQAFDLLELRDDLSRESRRLEKLVGGLIAMTPASEQLYRDSGSGGVAAPQLLYGC